MWKELPDVYRVSEVLLHSLEFVITNASMLYNQYNGASDSFALHQTDTFTTVFNNSNYLLF